MPSFYNKPLHERFTPVPLRARSDGWTVERQRGFVASLAQGATVPQAADGVGMSARSAYRLAERPRSASFRKAWATAISLAEPVAVDPRPLVRFVTHRWRKRVVHREVRWDEKTIARRLRGRDPYRWTAAKDEALNSYNPGGCDTPRCVNSATFRDEGTAAECLDEARRSIARRQSAGLSVVSRRALPSAVRRPRPAAPASGGSPPGWRSWGRCRGARSPPIGRVPTCRSDHRRRRRRRHRR